MKSPDASGFVYLDDAPPTDGESRVVRIPPGINSQRQLMAILALGLDFPNYFGWNWDALEECLCDLWWIEHPRRIVLLHEDLPFDATNEDRSVYLSILKNAISSWGPAEPHELLVVFPSTLRSTVEAAAEAH